MSCHASVLRALNPGAHAAGGGAGIGGGLLYLSVCFVLGYRDAPAWLKTGLVCLSRVKIKRPIVKRYAW